MTKVKHSPLKWLLRAVLALLLVKACTVTLAAVELHRATNDLRGVMSMSPADPESVERAAHRFSVAGARAIGEIRLLTPFFSLAGADGCTAAVLVEAAGTLSPVLNDLAALAAPVKQSLDSSPGDGLAVAPLVAHWRAVDTGASRTALDSVRALNACPSASPRMTGYADAAQSLSFSLDLFMSVPWDQVLADDVRWLIVLNNSDEIRATGGFTTALADLTVTDGVLRWRFLNSYSVDDLERLALYPEPPLPLRLFMGLRYWLFRDANWSPDHPTAAAETVRLFMRGQPAPEPVGVITVNLSALDTLAATLPALIVNGEPFNQDNALDRLRAEWNDDVHILDTDDPERKNFIQDFALAVSDAARAQMGAADTARLGLALRQMLDERDVMIYTSQSDLAAFLRERGWDGAMIDLPGDYLMVVDSNLGYNKVTPRIDRAITYTVNLQSRQANLEAAYTNTNTIDVDCTTYDIVATRPEQTPTYFDRMTACYWNYARVFAPPGSAIDGYDVADLPAAWFPFTHQPYRGHIDAWTEAGRPGFGALLVVPTGETRTLALDYTLPSSIVQPDGDASLYTLYVQQQAGAPDSSFTIIVTLPDDTTLVSAQPAPAQTNGQTLTFALTLERDQTVALRFR